MSVVKSKRGEGQLAIITKANELATYTIKICSNEKNFPKHYRWCITSKIVDAAIEISNYANMANSVYVKDSNDYALRKQYQTKALASTYALLSMMDIAYRTFGIESRRVEHWAGQMTRAQVNECYKSWKAHAEQGDTFNLVNKMNLYYQNLWR